MDEPDARTDKPRHRELERRRNRGTFYGESAKRAEEASEVQQPADSVAIYMVERAAIQLRRLRWAQSVEEAEASAHIDALAFDKAGKWHDEPRPVSGPMSEQLLAQYARPDEDAARKDRTVTDRVIGWFRKGDKKGPTGGGDRP